MKKIGIVTVLYNSSAVIKEFFQTLGKQNYKNMILYVVDNNSTDDSLQVCKEYENFLQIPVKYIINNENYGVAKGNNIGIKEAFNDNCDYILLSNNDIKLFPNTITELVNEMEKSQCDLTVPKIYFYGTKKIWYAGCNFNTIMGTTSHIDFLKEDNESHNINAYFEYAPTCFLLMTKDVLLKTGLMDEKYFCYYDDTDFIYRATQIQNFKLLYVSSSLVEHKESVSTGVLSDFHYRYVYRNRIYFLRKLIPYSFVGVSLNFIYHYSMQLLKMRKNIRQWKIIGKALFEGLKL